MIIYILYLTGNLSSRFRLACSIRSGYDQVHEALPDQEPGRTK